MKNRNWFLHKKTKKFLFGKVPLNFQKQFEQNKQFYKKKCKLIIIILLIIHFQFLINLDLHVFVRKKDNIKVAVCTMGRKENLYAREFMEYYMKLEVDHIFIYDNNDSDERIKNVLDNKYKDKISFYETKILHMNSQLEAFNDCYKNNLKKFDWFIMVDMDEFLYIVNDKLKNYLTNKIFDKCDFIKIHWANTQDNNLIHYDPRPLFQRFKKPYIKSNFIKTIIRGNITNLKYWVHSPYISPERNVTCTNDGKIINYKYMNFESIDKINTDKAYLIHFRFKSTEEFINKYKRGYNNWHGNRINQVLQERLDTYLKENGITLEKINYIERELKLDLSSYKSRIKLNHLKYLNPKDLIY